VILLTGERVDYASSGVDIDAGNKAVDLMRGYVKSTWGREVLADLGGFGGLFALDAAGYSNPVLVAGTDGVGTKLKVAFMADKHDTVGIDAVAMCVNDICVQGAHPLFFLDYIAVGKLVPEKVAEIVKGVSTGCREAGCALIGGETAEMPGMYSENEYDIAGFAVGIVERDKIVDGSRIKPGDQLLALGSSGLHSNGFSLVRKIVFELNKFQVSDYIPELGSTLAEELLKPTRIYAPITRRLFSAVDILGMAHITGGGITENVARILPEGCRAVIRKGSWNQLPVFQWLGQLGKLDQDEMYRTFNNGLGLVFAVRESDVGAVFQLCSAEGEKVFHVGEVTPGQREVKIV
jgi:phosphoribosylformylglycinamidine cyclo-ligase